jgi:ADP-ribose pyrophosphatase YjhB (NUDIX family)
MNKTQKKAKKVVCAGGVVRKIIGKKVFVALLRDKKSHNWFLPKGHVEKGETIEQTAYREIGEEAQLKNIKLIRKLGQKCRFSFNKKEYKTIHYFLFDCISDIKSGRLEKGIEGIHEIGWFVVSELPQIFWHDQKEIIKENLDIIKKNN